MQATLVDPANLLQASVTIPDGWSLQYGHIFAKNADQEGELGFYGVVVDEVYDEALIGALVTNPRVMRQLPRLLRAAGLELVTSSSYVLAEIGTAHFWSSAIEAYRRLLPKAGVMSEDEANAWAAALRSDSDARVFFGSSNYYAYVARRP